MPRTRTVSLSATERHALERCRDTHALAYLRERAAAVLKVADGQSAAQVARTGLLHPRKPDTVRRWLDRYQQDGLAGLAIRPGRGRKPAFSPSAAWADGGPGPGPAARPGPARPTLPGP